MAQGEAKEEKKRHCQSLNPNKTGGNAFEVPDKTIFHGMLGWLFELVVCSWGKQSFSHSLGHAPFIHSPEAFRTINKPIDSKSVLWLHKVHSGFKGQAGVGLRFLGQRETGPRWFVVCSDHWFHWLFWFDERYCFYCFVFLEDPVIKMQQNTVWSFYEGEVRLSVLTSNQYLLRFWAE